MIRYLSKARAEAILNEFLGWIPDREDRPTYTLAKMILGGYAKHGNYYRSLVDYVEYIVHSLSIDDLTEQMKDSGCYSVGEFIDWVVDMLEIAEANIDMNKGD